MYILVITIGVLFCALVLCVISWFVFCSKYKRINKNLESSLQRMQSANSVLSKSKSKSIGRKDVQLAEFVTRDSNADEKMNNIHTSIKNNKIGDINGHGDGTHVVDTVGTARGEDYDQEYQDEDEDEQENMSIFNEAGEGQETQLETTNY